MSDVPPQYASAKEEYTNVDLGLPPEGIQPQVLEPNPFDEQDSKKLYDHTEKAYADGNSELGDQLSELQAQRAWISNGLVERAGGDPRTEVSSMSSWMSESVEAQRQFVLKRKIVARMEEVFKGSPTGDYPPIEAFNDYLTNSILPRYKEKNEAAFRQRKQNMTPQEELDYQVQLEPVVEDFAVLQDWQQKLDKLNYAMRQVDPANRKISVYNHEKTKKFAQWLGREAGVFQPGYVISGEQPTGKTAFQTATEYAFSITEQPIDLVGRLVFGLGPALNALTGGRVGWSEPTNYTEDEDGNIITNAGKVPGGVEFGALVWNLFLNEDLKETIARANAAKAWERHNETTFDSITKGVGMALGGLYTYHGIMGSALKFGSGAGGAAARGVSRGLERLGMSASEKSLKLAEILGRTLGGTSALAMTEAVMDGRSGTYQKALTHGALLVPVLIGIGAAGKYFDRAISARYPKMPPRFVNTINGALQGGMFQALEDIQGHAIFGLIQDPNKSTLQRYIEIMLAFGIMKGLRGQALPEFQAARTQRARDQATSRFGEEMFQAEAFRKAGRPVEVTEEDFRAQARQLPKKLIRDKGEVTRKRKEGRPDVAKEAKIDDEIARYDQREGEREKEFEERMEDEGFAPRTEEKNEELRRRRKARRAKRISQRVDEPTEADFEFMDELGIQWQPLGKLADMPGKKRVAEFERRRERAEKRAQLRADAEALPEPAEVPLVTEPPAEPGVGLKPVEEPLEPPEPPAKVTKEKIGYLGETTLEGVIYEVGYSGMSVKAGKAILAAADLDPGLLVSGHAIRTKNRAVAEAYRDALRKLGAKAKMAAVTEPQEEVKLKPLYDDEGNIVGYEQRPVDPGAGKPPEGFELNMPAGQGPPGGRRVPGSMADPASPHRAEFKEPKIGVKPIRASDVIRFMGGQAGHPGTRWPFTTKPIVIKIPIIGKGMKTLVGPVKATAIVVPMRSGHLLARTTKGVYDIFSNVARTKEGLNVIVSAHEWGHALQRQAFFRGAAEDVIAQATAWVENMGPDMLKDVWALLEGYPGRENLEPWRMGMEAWAEFTARKLLGDETVDAEAPIFAKMFRNWLQQPEQAYLRESSWEPVKDALIRYMEQGYERQADEEFFMAGEGAREIVGSVRRTLGEWVEDNVIDRFHRAWVDDVQPLKRAVERAYRAAGIEMEDVDIFEDPGRMLDVTRNMGLAQTVNFFMKGRFNLAAEKVPGSEGLIDIVQDAVTAELGKIGSSTREFGLYLAHHRAWMKIRRGIDMGTPAKVYAQSVLAKSRRNPGFKNLARRTKVWTDSIVDFGVEGGLFSPKEAELMKKAGVIYVPLIAALKGPKRVAPGRGVAERGKGTKRFKGHTQEHKDPLLAMQEVVQDMITKVYHNMTVKALYMAGLREGMGRLVTVVDRSMVAQKFRAGEVWRSFQKVVLAELDKMKAKGEPFDQEELLREAFGKLGPLVNEAGVMESLVTLFTQQNLPFGETEGVIAFTPHLTPYELGRYQGEARRRAEAQNHKLLFLETDPGVYRVFMGAQALRGPEHYLENPILRAIILGPAKIMRNLAVRFNPLFGVVNVGRDVAAYPVFNPRTGLGPGGRAIDAVKAWPLWIEGVGRLLRDGKEDEVRQLFENTGVGMSMLWNEGVRAQLRGEAVDRVDAAAAWIRKLGENWANFWGKGEGALRLMAMADVYVNYKGNNPVERALLSAEAGQESTINFARGGTYAKILTQMKPFITATINGMRRFVRAAAGSEGKTPAQKAANQRAAFLNAMIGMTIPQVVLAWWHSDEDWYRDLPAWKKISRIYLTEHIWIPLPFELGVIAASAPQALTDYIMDANPVGIGDLIKEALFPYLKGLEGFFPVAIQAPLEVRTGYGFYFDSPITPRRLQSKRSYEQVTANTTAAAQWVFNNFKGLVNLAGIDNAIELEHFLNGFSAGKGTVGLRAVDGLFGLKDDPGFTRHLLSRFWTPPHAQSRIVQQLYDRQAVLADIKPEDMTFEQRRLYRRINQATKYFTELRTAEREGQRTREQINKEMFEVADTVLNPDRGR